MLVILVGCPAGDASPPSTPEVAPAAREPASTPTWWCFLGSNDGGPNLGRCFRDAPECSSRLAAMEPGFVADPSECISRAQAYCHGIGTASESCATTRDGCERERTGAKGAGTCEHYPSGPPP